MDYLPLKGVSKLLQIRQHVPADITVLSEYSDGRCLDVDSEGTVFVCEHDKAIKVWPKQAAALQIQQLRRPQLIAELDKRTLPTDGTVPILRARLKDYLQATKQGNEKKGIQMDEVQFAEKLSPSCICLVEEPNLVVASDNSQSFYRVEISSDGVVFQGKHEILAKYPEGVHRVSSMTFHENGLFFVHEGGIGKVDLATKLSSIVLKNNTRECHTCEAVTSSQEGLIFCDSGAHEVKILSNIGETMTIAGSGREGNSDGCAGDAAFSQLKDATVDQNTVFICDGQTGYIKMIVELNGTVTFLKNLGMFYNAFGIHLKHKRPEKTQTLQQCIETVKKVQTYLETTVSTRQAVLNTTRQLNGPEGAVSARTIKSVEMIASELERLQKVINDTTDGMFKIDMQSTLTLCVENIHAVGHFKQQFPTMLEHARNISNTVRESLKRIASWAAVYYTHRDTYYPVPDGKSFTIQEIPKMDRLFPRQNLSQEMKQKMRDWANDHGKCVRQRTVRQQSTMFNAGTLPLNMYENNSSILNEKVVLPDRNNDHVVRDDVSQNESPPSTGASSFIQVDTYDTDSSDENGEHETSGDSNSESEAPSCLDFLVGRVSRSGRQIRFRHF